MARYAKIGHKMGSLRKWLPEVTTTLLCLLIVGTVLRVVSATEKGITIYSFILIPFLSEL